MQGSTCIHRGSAIWVAAAAGLVSACVADGPPPADPPATSYRYACDDGLAFTARFDPATDSALIQLSNSVNDVLIQGVSASGALYTSQQHRLHIKGSEALLDTLYNGTTHHCAAADFPRQ
jgi:membrane-bound inhibitor of C-type lysozyme